VIMPPMGSALLEGITMRTAIDFMEEEGITIHFENIDRSIIYSCDEMLLTGTAAQVTFVESVDGRKIGKAPSHTVGPLCSLLRKKFAQVLTKEHPRSKEWITEFKNE
jgi:branched-chain amino acid aminotransferase